MERIKFFFQVETEIRAEVSWWWRWPGWWWPWWCTSCGPTAWEASLRASHRVRFLEPLIVKLLVIKLIVCAILNWLFTAQCISYMAHSWLSYNWNTCEIVGSGKLDNWKITLVPNIREASCLFMCHIYWEKLITALNLIRYTRQVLKSNKLIVLEIHYIWDCDNFNSFLKST